MILSSALALLPFGFLALDSLRAQVGVEGFHRAGIKGKGVIIGLSEWVDYSLWDFRHPDGTTRFLRYMGKGPRELDSLLRVHYPENRFYPYRKGWDDSLRIHHYDTFHGTAVLGIAAGNGRSKGHADLSGTFVGMAPEADLVAGDYDEVKAFADSLRRPFVFNHSYASNVGVPTDSSTAGKIVVISSGNAHVRGVRHRFSAGDTQGLTLHFRPASRLFHRVADSTYQFDVLFRIGMSGGASLRIALQSPNDTVLRYRLDFPASDPVEDTVRGKVPDEAYEKCLADSLLPYERVRIGRIYGFYPSPFDTNPGLRYSVRTRAFRDFTVRIDRTAFGAETEMQLRIEAISHRCVRLVQADEFGDILKGTMTLMASTENGHYPDQDAIHVAAFARNAYPFPPHFDPPYQRSGDIAYYSGRGDFAASGLVKPEIAAPAHRITSLAAYGPWDQGQGRPDSIHGDFDGTSAAAPVISGAAALLLQMDPTLDDDALRSILRENARTDAFTGAVPNDAWGYGKFHLDWEKVRKRLGYVGTGGTRPAWRAAAPFPNPFRGRTRIEWVSREPDPSAFLEVRDLRGRVLLRAPPLPLPGRLAWEVEGSAWPAGVYPYRVHTRAGDRLGKLIRAD